MLTIDAPRLAQRRQCGLDRIEHARELEIELITPIVERGFGARLHPRASRIVHQPIETPEPVLSGLDEAGHGFTVAYVARGGQDTITPGKFAQCGIESVDVARARHDLRAFVEQHRDGRESDTGAAAGDQIGAVFQVQVHDPVLPWSSAGRIRR